MPNRQYEAGDRFEKRVKPDLEERGYVCWQTRGSKTAVDIIALANFSERRDDILLVQVKSGVRKLYHSEWNAIYSLAMKVAALPVIADRDGRKIRYRLITGYHTYRSRDWPAEDYQP